MNSRFWTATAMSLILGSFIAFAFITRKPLCIDSKLVEKIDRIGAADTATVYRCSLRKVVPYSEKWAEQQTEISRRLISVERAFESLGPLELPVQISVLEGKSNVFKILDHEIFLSEELFNQQSVLERALLKVWYREKANSSLLDHPVFEESMIDLVLFAIHGIGPFTPGPNLKWPFVAKTLKSYCTSSWRQLEHEVFCAQARLTDKLSDTQRPLVAASLRPLLTESLISAYLDLTMKERKVLIESVSSLIGSLELQQEGVGFTSVFESQQSLVDLSAELSTLVQNLYHQANELGLRRWTQAIARHLASAGFSEEPLTAQTDLLLVLKGLKGSQIFAASLWTVDAGLTALAYDDEKLYLLPNSEGLDRGLLGRVMASKVIYVHCGPLLVQELVPFFERAAGILAIQTCDPNQKLRFTSSIETFASANPQVKFMDIHLPSLALALKLKKLKSNELLSSNGKDWGQVQLALGWQKPSLDAQLNFYRVQGSIDAIRSYRP